MYLNILRNGGENMIRHLVSPYFSLFGIFYFMLAIRLSSDLPLYYGIPAVILILIVGAFIEFKMHKKLGIKPCDCSECKNFSDFKKEYDQYQEFLNNKEGN